MSASLLSALHLMYLFATLNNKTTTNTTTTKILKKKRKEEEERKKIADSQHSSLK